MSPLAATVAISVSEPEERELAARGLAGEHVHHAYVELARQILAAGGSLAYGGNPRAGEPNYVQILLALLRTYSKPDRPPAERIQLYLAAPVWREMTTTDRARIRVLATLNEVPSAGDELGPAGPDFTLMREAMAAATTARIILGGRLQGPFGGRWPGIVEEAYLTIGADRPLYIVGGLGGAAALVADLVRRCEPADDGLADVETLRAAIGGADLRNGLTTEENELLFETADLDLIVGLILRGLGSADR